MVKKILAVFGSIIASLLVINAILLIVEPMSNLQQDVRTVDSMYQEEAVSETMSMEIASDSVVKSSYVTLETTDFDESQNRLRELMEEYESQIQYEEDYQTPQNEDSPQRWNITFQIAAEDLDSFVEALKEIPNADITYQSIDQTNVAEEIQDNDKRLESLNKQLQKLNELYDQADNLADTIELETAINDVIVQIEELESMQNAYKDQIDFATITLALREVLLLEVHSNNFFNQLPVMLIQLLKEVLIMISEGLILVLRLFPLLVLMYWALSDLRKSKN